jgi:hypothetical protein
MPKVTLFPSYRNKNKGYFMSTINDRHLELMTDLIDKQRTGKIKFSHFVNRLDELIINLENPPQGWLEDAKLLWFELEEINAVLLDESNTVSTIETYRKEIDQKLARLTDLLTASPYSDHRLKKELRRM